MLATQNKNNQLAVLHNTNITQLHLTNALQLFCRLVKADLDMQLSSNL